MTLDSETHGLHSLSSAVTHVAEFLGGATLTGSIGEIEHMLSGASASRVQEIAAQRRVDGDLLRAAGTVRRELGRISDLIHAAAILVALPRILEPGEVVTNRPSLAAGNDPARPYDLETDRRIAEFKLSNWAGADAMRKRQAFKDLVHLAADKSNRRPELYVVGDAPARFLRSSRSTARWALDKSPTTQVLFERQFGSLDAHISSFTTGAGARVKIINLVEILPELASTAGL